MIRYSDNRNFFRMMVNTNIEIDIADADAGRKIDAVCRDLSATGMAVETDEPVEVGTSVVCKLEGASPELPALKASATVVRCSQEESGSYLLGIEIIEHL
ncbi:PilZ domain-containing protein [Psychrosphaera saromensis]|uniref:Pilus assembly protein PilZ n=1 Tax=Psychrosphaera saromensis TaxID=716813 RepID=A0A2S7UXV5_9GAMM|nr:PilZ domain-containing protein [Psychrosphaera saromensis]PQJ54599.1 pilus assembly protein PilZ [Psychrosphaera saromensis]GHB58698.1 PilZ domain-containing protein [Psychrosphaera saromensis]GLQ14182.1 PilZ domain-containing protein [Psychrosphaera saromensis]